MNTEKDYNHNYEKVVIPGGGYPTGTPPSSSTSSNSSNYSDESEEGGANTKVRDRIRNMVEDPEQRRLWREEMKRSQKDNNDKIFSWFEDEDKEDLGRRLGFPEEEPVRLPTSSLKTKDNSRDRDEARTTQEDQEK